MQSSPSHTTFVCRELEPEGLLKANEWGGVPSTPSHTIFVLRGFEPDGLLKANEKGVAERTVAYNFVIFRYIFVVFFCYFLLFLLFSLYMYTYKRVRVPGRFFGLPPPSSHNRSNRNYAHMLIVVTLIE